MSIDVFISHSNQDNDAATFVYDELVSKNFKCWMDLKDLHGGADFAEQIVDAIMECRLVVLVFSAKANKAKGVKKELGIAYNHDKTIVSFRLDDTDYCKALQYYLNTRQWIDGYPGPYQNHIPKLIDDVKLNMLSLSKFDIIMDAPALSCAQDDTLQAKVTLTNSSEQAAMFETFILKPGESRELWYDLETHTPGRFEKEISIPFKDIEGEDHMARTIIKYVVEEPIPVIKAIAEPLQIFQDEKKVARIVLTNLSEYAAFFDSFVLKKGESHEINAVVEGLATGGAETTMLLSYRNIAGRRFDLPIKIRYVVNPKMPDIDLKVESTENIDGNSFLIASLSNMSEHVAYFDNFSLEMGEVMPIRVPIEGRKPGKYETTVKLTYKNGYGREFEKNYNVSYTISSEDLKRPALSTSAKKSVFIGYAHQDLHVANKIVETLEANGLSCWTAPRDVNPGTPFEKAIMEGISHADIFVVVFSSKSNQSAHVQNEVREAWKRGIPIVPFLIENSPMGDVMSYYISSMHWIDASTPPIDQHIESLRNAIIFLLKEKRPGKNV